jgi:hypothetical protein
MKGAAEAKRSYHASAAGRACWVLSPEGFGEVHVQANDPLRAL